MDNAVTPADRPIVTDQQSAQCHDNVPGYHHIEERPGVYIHANRDGTGWELCDFSLADQGLFGLDNGASNDGCECGDHPGGDRPECEAWKTRLDALPLPSGEDLMHMLAAALGYSVTSK
jgi:hypothetical protein